MATRTSGSAGGPGKRTSRNADTAPRAHPTSRRSATAAGCSASVSRSRMPFTRPAGARSSAWMSAPRRPRRSGRSSCARSSRAASWRVQLAISDAHRVEAAIARVLGSSWQRCTVHFLRDLRGHCRKDQHDALGALIRQLFTAHRRRRNTPTLGRRERSARVAAAEDRQPARGGRRRRPGVLRVPFRALAQAALDQSAGALQPRDRPTHRPSASSPTTPRSSAWRR